jgi:hypothetical protein
MKYGLFNETQSPADIGSYIDGAHIIVMRDVNNFIESTIELEDLGWEIRDSIKVLFDDKSLQAILLRKPFKGTIVNNFLSKGCGGINIDICRIPHNDPMIIRKDFDSNTGEIFTRAKGDSAGPSPKGRFPTNLILQKGIALQQGSDSSRFFFQFDSRQELETYLTTMIRID